MRYFQSDLTRSVLSRTSWKLALMIGSRGLTIVPNLVRIGSAGSSPGADEISRNRGLACLFFVLFFFSRDRALVKPVGRFWRVIRQNACFGPRRCLLGFRKINIPVFTPKIAKNPNFGALSMHFLWKNKNTNNYWTVSPIITKFGMQSLMRTPKSAVCSKIKKIENPRWPPTPLFFVVLGIAPWSNPWADFGE